MLSIEFKSYQFIPMFYYWSDVFASLIRQFDGEKANVVLVLISPLAALRSYFGRNMVKTHALLVKKKLKNGSTFFNTWN